jgi:hypothetical protein
LLISDEFGTVDDAFNGIISFPGVVDAFTGVGAFTGAGAFTGVGVGVCEFNGVVGAFRGVDGLTFPCEDRADGFVREMDRGSVVIGSAVLSDGNEILEGVAGLLPSSLFGPMITSTSLVAGVSTNNDVIGTDSFPASFDLSGMTTGTEFDPVRCPVLFPAKTMK